MKKIANFLKTLSIGLIVGLVIGLGFGMNIGKGKPIFSNPFAGHALEKKLKKTGDDILEKSGKVLEKSGKNLQKKLKD